MVENKKKAKLLALVSIIFFSVSGGPYGLEEIVSSVGPLNTLLLILLLPIVWTIPETMIVAELSSSYPIQGGYYRWVQISMGRFWGFMEGWWSTLYTLIDLSLYPILFSTYLKILFPSIDSHLLYFIQLIMIWVCAVVNILGIRVVGNILTSFQFFILFTFAIFIILGMNHISFDFSSIMGSYQQPTSSKLFLGLSIAFWNFIGWDNGSTVLHEVDNPGLNYHKALFISIPIIVFFYFFPTLVGLCIHTSWQDWKFGEFSFISNSMGFPFLGTVLAVGGMLTSLGLFNSMLLSSTRVIMTLAEDKLLPSMFSAVHSKYETPHIAIIFTALAYSVLVLFSFETLIGYDVFLYLIAILLEAIALVILRKRNPDIYSHYKIPFGMAGVYCIVSIVSLVVLFMVVINLSCFHGDIKTSFFTAFLMLSGVPIYLWYEKLKALSNK